MPRVGEYELGKTVGKGAFSKVKLCTHVPTNKEYVAKIVPKSNKDVEGEIRVEIAILRRVKQQNVVQLVEILESPRNYYIVLEAVTGGDLCDLIMSRRGGLPVPEAAEYFAQLVDALIACHAVGVAHRDLKPENVLLNSNNEVKVSDFGLSRLHERSVGSAVPSEFAQTLTGTLAYVPPEVLVGRYDAFMADLWSLGCVLYVMVTGKFPFGSAAEEELEARIKQADLVPLPQEIPPQCAEVIYGLIQRDPKSRLPLSALLQHPFVTSTNVYQTRYGTGKNPIKEAAVAGGSALGGKVPEPDPFSSVEEPQHPVAPTSPAIKPARRKLPPA